MSHALFPVVLSGGSGTRLWPLSRAMYPKQFIRFFSGQQKTFLGATLTRLPASKGFAPPIVLCNNDHRFLIREELDKTGTSAHAIVLEPVARNTAPAIAVAAEIALRENPEAILVVMPSDHAVRDEAAFVAAVHKAAGVAAAGRLALFGITPDSPHTGYGYIRRGEKIVAGAGKNGAAADASSETGAGRSGAYRVEAFVEKPKREVAEQYLASGTYYWNSGIFVLHARTFLDELVRLEPGIVAAARAALAKAKPDLGFLRLDAESFAEADDISIDYAVMEKTALAVMLPVDVGWNDVGSWSSLWDMAPRDGNGNYVNGDGVLIDTTGSYVHSDKALVATIGVDNLVIVDTPDALLVADRARAQDVGKLVQTLKKSNRREQQQHLRNLRPWGFFETLSLAPRFQVKLLHVKPGEKLSMQMHHHRSEHWVVVQGTAKVVVGETEQLVRENESVYIQATQWHRLENPGKVPLELIEVQLGTYLGEDDIIRTDDVYNRAASETK